MTDNPAEQDEATAGEIKTPRPGDGTVPWPGGEPSSGGGLPAGRARPRWLSARSGGDVGRPTRASVVDDMKMTEDLEPD
jgi:hypothetical protein